MKMSNIIKIIPLFSLCTTVYCVEEQSTRSYQDELLPAQAYYEAALKGELSKEDENKKRFLSSMTLVSKKSGGVSEGGIYKDSNNDIWIVKNNRYIVNFDGFLKSIDQSPIDEYLGSKVMNLLIGPWSPEITILVDAPDYTASKLLSGFVVKADLDLTENKKPIVGEENLEVAMNLMGLIERHDGNMGYIETGNRLEAARVDFDDSFEFTSSENAIKNLNLMEEGVKNIYSIPDELILYVLGDAFNSLWAAGISLNYEKYKDLGSILIARKRGLMGVGKELIESIKKKDSNVDAIKLLLEKEKNIDAFNVRDLLNNTLLDLAVQLKKSDIIRFLLEQSAQNPQALVKAVRMRDKEMVQSLLERGADPRAQNSQALIDAVRMNYKEIVQLLLEHGADPKAQGSEALIYAAWAKNVKLVQLLLEYGADPNAQDSLAFVKATWQRLDNHIEVIQLLLEHGANPNVQNSQFLIEAAEHGDTKLVQLLLKYGADPNAQDSLALVKAAWRGDIELVQLLLEYGADFEAQDSQLLAAAVWNGWNSIKERLFE